MRKSLGNKRNEIGETERSEIVRLYGDFKVGEHVRLFDNADFGYRRLTVERPLRLNFSAASDRLARLEEASAFSGLAASRKRKDVRGAEQEISEGQALQEAIRDVLKTLKSVGVINSREVFTDHLERAFKKVSLKVPAPLFKAILAALSERDDSADICQGPDGKPEPDPELRDFENVPLKEDVTEYMKREVLPHMPDAWVDEAKTKIGYEINFNRYFYKYQPPRPLEDIEVDLQKIEREIAGMLGGSAS
jgi:type I restriction enzyme M protein